MAGPSRAAPPMPDPFDPAEFDAPPPADPGADYRVLLDAMRQAGADGIAQQSAALVQRIEQDARQRLERGERMGTAVDVLQRVAGPLQRVRSGQWVARRRERSEKRRVGKWYVSTGTISVSVDLDKKKN